MKDHWKMIDGEIDIKHSWKDLAVILLASFAITGIIHDLMKFML